MSRYTKANLDSMNKGQVVEVALSLAAQVEAASGAPLTSAELEKRLLDLSTLATTVKSNDEKASQAHAERMAKITADYQKEIKTLELQYESSASLSVKDLNDAYNEIKAKAEEAISNLSYGLKEAEIAANGKLEVISSKVEEAEAKYAEVSAGIKEAISNEMAEKVAEISKIKVDHTRKLEQIEYDNGIAIRDVNEKAATKIASTLGKELISSEDLKSLKEERKLSEDEFMEAISSAVSASEAKIYSIEKAKYSKLESESKSTIALLENDKKHLTETVSSQNDRIADLEERLKDVPAQIANAVSAAKANVSVSQTGSGK